MESSDDEALNDTLLKQLECPVCFECCMPPIYMCKNGHNLCPKCRAMVRECVVCRAIGQPSIRNLFAENMSAKVKLACKNADEGCREMLNIKDMEAHLLKCQDQFSYECRLPGVAPHQQQQQHPHTTVAPTGEHKLQRRLTFNKNKVSPVKKGVSDSQIVLSRTDYIREKDPHHAKPPQNWCPWRGKRSDLEAHVIADHPGCFTRDDPVELTCSLLTSSDRVEENTRLCLADGQYFWCVWHYSRDRAVMSGHATYVGGNKAAAKFKSEVKLCTENGDKVMSYVSGVRILEDSFHVINSKRCLTIDEDMIRQFSVNGDVKCRIKIMKMIT